MTPEKNKLIHDAAKCLGAKIESPLEQHIMDAAIDLASLRPRDPTQSDAMNTALGAIEDAKQTLLSTQETCEEVRASEAEAEAEGEEDDGA